MYLDFKKDNYEVDEYTEMLWNGDYPVMTVDRDTQMSGVRVETGLEYHIEDNCYNLQIGKYNSFAEDIVFLIDINHDYKRVCQGRVREFGDFFGIPFRIKRKGGILIMNDVWIGHGVTVMEGVTIHNGAVVAAGSVVTKDVPPYAIVAGNPARIIKYRLEDEDIRKMLSIGWWDWTPEMMAERSADLRLPLDDFIRKYIDSGDNTVPEDVKNRFVFNVDLACDHSFTAHVIDDFCRTFSDGSAELVLFFDEKNIPFEKAVVEFLGDYEDTDAKISLIDDGSIAEWIAKSEAYITGRGESVVSNATLAERYKKSIIHGCSIPIWGEPDLN